MRDDRVNLDNANFHLGRAGEHLTSAVNDVWEAMLRPFILMRPKLGVDGNQYCFLYGDDLMSGVAGFGATAEEASRDFDKNWRGSKVPGSGIQP